MIEWMAEAAPFWKATTLKKMNDRSLLLSINKITHYFKNGQLEVVFWKKIYFLYKNVILQKDPPESNCSQKQQYSKRTLRLKVLQKSSSLEKVAVLAVHLQVQLFTTALLKHSLYNSWITAITVVKLSN